MANLVQEIIDSSTATTGKFKKGLFVGLGLGLSGRAVDFKPLPLVLPAIDLFRGEAKPSNIPEYVGLTTGVGLAYADKAWEVVKPGLDKIYNWIF
ncbi:hypothetical protein ISS08_02015 [Candidatus Pacearchaeota archaeon]|nr:hypothetical protein [Candidatus Pacearchaeota archaeon]